MRFDKSSRNVLLYVKSRVVKLRPGRREGRWRKRRERVRLLGAFYLRRFFASPRMTNTPKELQIYKQNSLQSPKACMRSCQIVSVFSCIRIPYCNTLADFRYNY